MTVVGNIVSEILWNRLGIYLGIYIYIVEFLILLASF